MYSFSCSVHAPVIRLGPVGLPVFQRGSAIWAQPLWMVACRLPSRSFRPPAHGVQRIAQQLAEAGALRHVRDSPARGGGKAARNAPNRHSVKASAMARGGGYIAVGQHTETPQVHQRLHLGDQVPHRGRKADAFQLGGVAREAPVAEGQVFGGLQAAKVVQAVVLQSLQGRRRSGSRPGRTGLRCQTGPWRGRGGQLFAHRGSCLLSVISLRSKTLARKSWFCSVRGRRAPAGGRSRRPVLSSSK